MKYIFSTALAILLPVLMYAEGIKQLAPDSLYYTALAIQFGTTNCFGMESCDADHKLYVHIDHPGEKIFMGIGFFGSGPVSVKFQLNGTLIYGPVSISPVTDGYIKYFSQAYAGPDILSPAGYHSINFAPPAAGDYEIDFGQSFTLTKVDVTVIDTTILPLAPTNGRLWAKKWVFRTNGVNLPSNAFLGTMHVYTEDSVVTSVFFNKMQGDYFEISCNANGCYPPPMKWDSSCKSAIGEHVYPQYRIFVNNPDSVCYPTGILGTIDQGTISVTPGCDGSFTIHFFAGKPGSVKAILEVDPAPGIQPEDVVLMNPVLAGWNNLFWNGMNGLGQPLDAGTQVHLVLTFVNGLTNLPIFDVEKQVHGFVISQLRPPGASIATYWNDTILVDKGGRVQLTGCYGYDTIGCHRWNGYYGGIGIGSMNTVNTWWYATSNTTAPIILTVRHPPATPDDISGPVSFCSSAINTYSIVPDPLPGADPGTYEWTLTDDATGTVLLDMANQGPAITIDFSAFPAGNMHLKARGSNSDCGAGNYGPGISGDGIPLQINISPQITNATTTFPVCSGNLFDVMLQSSLPSTTYLYTAFATALNVSGYSGGNTNIIQQQLFNTGNEVDSVIYRVVPFALGCSGDATVFYAPVTPLPGVINTVTTFEVCTGNATDIVLASNVPSAGFSWTATGSDPSVSGYSGSAGTVIAQTLYNPGSVVQTVTYTVTPALNSCTGIQKVFTADVTPGQLLTIDIAASSNPFCSGNPVTFTATTSNGGISPTYQWTVNGGNAGTNNAIFIYPPASGDIIACDLSVTGPCISGNPASSNQITMTANTTLPAGISIAASSNPFCPETAVTFTAAPTNGGSAPVYRWDVNGTSTGTNSNTFIYYPAANDSISCLMTSSLNCVTSNPASSGKIIMMGSLPPNVTFATCFDTVTTIGAKPFKLKGGIPLGGTYSGPGVNPSTSMFTPSAAGTGLKTMVYSYTNVSLCSANMSKTIFVQPNPSFTCGNNFTDIRDNKTYPTIQIGYQCWMKTNLNFGLTIDDFSQQTDNCIAEHFTRTSTFVNQYSIFYQWDELMQYQTAEASQGLCPPGWHIPASAEWDELLLVYQGPGIAGSLLKDTLLAGGFHSRQTGFLYLNNLWAFTAGLTTGSIYWTSTATGTDRAVARGLNAYNLSVSRYEGARGNGFGVRCLQDN